MPFGVTVTPTAESRGHDAQAVGLSSVPSEIVVALLQASPDCIKLMTCEGVLEFMNFGGLCQMEIGNFADVEGEFWWSLWPEAERPLLRQAVSDAARGAMQRFIAPCPTATGTPKWWEVAVTPVYGAFGQVEHLLAVSRDVTGLIERTIDLEQSLAISELLRQEVDHRVKNSLSIVTSLLRLQARRAEAETSAALISAAARVQTIGNVHDMLHKLDGQSVVDLGAYLKLLGADLYSALIGDQDIDCDVQVVSLDMAVKDVVAVGLAVTELITNAIKHGQLQAQDRLWLVMEIENQTVKITVRDSGAGLPIGFDPVAHGGIGMQVVQAMVDQIGGQLGHSTPDDGGSEFIIQFARPQGQ